VTCFENNLISECDLTITISCWSYTSIVLAMRSLITSRVNCKTIARHKQNFRLMNRKMASYVEILDSRLEMCVAYFVFQKIRLEKCAKFELDLSSKWSRVGIV